MDQVVDWFHAYGYWILFIGLFLEFLFLPFPGGTVMAISGILAHQGQLTYLLCILLSVFGTSLGMAASYFIGLKLGSPFFDRFGSKLFMGPKRRKAVENWFNRFGNKVVFISFFIPGIRHFTGYFSGMMRLDARVFFIYTIGGATLWATTYVSMGYFFGQKWKYIAQPFHTYTVPLVIGATVILVSYLILKRWCWRKKQD